MKKTNTHEGDRRPTVLVVEDNLQMQKLLQMNLAQDGFNVQIASNGDQALQILREGTQPLDCMVLDLIMPGVDGFDVLKRAQEMKRPFTIVLTAMNGEENVVKAFEYGADDFVVKPFRYAELRARIQALLRRSRWPALINQNEVVRVDDHLEIDFKEGVVIVNGEKKPLRNTEKRLLYQLVMHRGKVVPASSLLASVWGSECRDQVDHLRLYISYLRSKIEPQGSGLRYLFTRHGIGYMFAGADDVAPVAALEGDDIGDLKCNPVARKSISCDI